MEIRGSSWGRTDRVMPCRLSNRREFCLGPAHYARGAVHDIATKGYVLRKTARFPRKRLNIT